MLHEPDDGANNGSIEVFGAQIRLRVEQAEDDTAIGEVSRKAGISEATFYN